MNSPLSKDTLIAVVGAGAMGAGIAQVAAQAGHPVKLLDTRPGAAIKAIAGIAAQFDKLAAKGKITLDAAQAASNRLQAAESLADLADCGLVIEAIVEDLAAKQTLYADLESIVSADCIFGTNTSSISVTAIGAALKHPERLVGLHFFNPAPLMALVEIVSGLATAPALATCLFDTAKAWGKTPVYAKSTPGFIVNRVARSYYGEALRVLTEGGADPATLDACCRESGGFRMGPFELMDMIGHDVNFAVSNSVWKAFFNDQRFTPSLVQQELVNAGFLGKKSGRGFYDYREGANKPLPATEAAQAVPGDAVIYGTSAAALALAARLSARGVPFARADAQGDTVASVQGTILRISDGRTATHCARDNHQPNTVLMDLALDYASASRIAIAASAQCSAEGVDAVVGLLQAAGLAVSKLRDIPGLIVMRTVAMLANEAADAVNQGVCSAKAVDTAMRLGVNYPQGPLAWADAVGVAQIGKVLTHLAQTYGEDRYRTSPLIHHCVCAAKALHD